MYVFRAGVNVSGGGDGMLDMKVTHPVARLSTLIRKG